MPIKNALIIANGQLPNKHLVQKFVGLTDIIICADGGANSARKHSINPNIIIGDMDSITPATKRFFNNITQLHLLDQETTDLEKALEYCVLSKMKSVVILGATGDRIDHTAMGLGCFRSYGNKLKIKLVDSVGELSLIEKRIRFKSEIGDKISLIPLDRCMGITTHGLKYILKNNSLKLGIRNGISNEAISKIVEINLKKGMLLLYRLY